MPRVPTYTDPQVRTEALPGARLTYNPGNPGEAIGRGLQQAGKGITDLWLTEQKRQSEIAVLEADRKLSGASIDLLHNPETGALNRKGKDALTLQDEVLPAFDKTVQEIGKGLSNQAQRDAFQRLVASRRTELDGTVLRHVSAEMRRFEDSELDAYIKNAHDAALANPAGAGNEIERQRLAIGSYADRNGMGPEWFRLKFGEASSRTHLGVLDGMLARGEDQQALAYYQTNGSQLIGEDRARAEKALEVGTLRGESQRAADAITAQYTDPAAMMAAVEGIKDPKLRDATEERVQRKIRFLAETSRAEQDNAFTNAWSVVEQTGDVYQIPPAVWGSLPPARRQALTKYAKAVASGADVANDDKKWLEFLALPERRLTEMSEADLLGDYMPHFDKAHRDRAMTRFATARKAAQGDGSAKAKHAATRTFDDVVSSTLARAGIGLKLGYSKTDLKKLSEDKQQVVAEFEAQADAAIKHYEVTQLGGKRAANSEEMQKVVDSLLMRKVFVEGRMWGGEERPLAVLTESERERARWPDAPRDPKTRTPGQTYRTPKGDLTWTGTGWLKN